MHFLKTMLVGAAMATMAVAQSGLAFTSTPTSVTAGKPVTITYAGGDSTPATITLRKGDPNNLQTISVLTTSATGGSYTWTPDASLADGSDYALQITQGLTSINYSGQFSLSGGSASAQSSASATSSASMASASSSSSTASVSSASMASAYSSSSSASVSSASIASAYSSSSSASVSSAIASLNSTVSSIIAGFNSSMPTTTVIGTAVSAGTGTAIARNTTMSMATLTSTASSTASITTGFGSSGASSGSGAAGSTSTSGPKSSAAGLASPLAFVLSAVAAIIYLN